MLLVGPSGSGKSVLIRYIIHRLGLDDRYEKIIDPFTGEVSRGDLIDDPDRLLIGFSDFDDDELGGHKIPKAEFIESVKKIFKIYNESPADFPKRVLMYCDDMTGEKSIEGVNAPIKKLLTTTRHFHLPILCCVHELHALFYKVRSQFTDYILFPGIDEEYLKSFYKELTMIHSRNYTVNDFIKEYQNHTGYEVDFRDKDGGDNPEK